MDIRFPIGPWQRPNEISPELVEKWIFDIQNLPESLRLLSNKLNKNNIHNVYREGGWNINQLIHHIADSHINAYLRHKLCVSLETPTINPYPEEIWSEMADVREVSHMTSINLIEALHLRWSVFLFALNENDFKKGFIHPQHNRLILLEESIGMYSWHGRHHLEHIKIALSR